MAEASDTLHDYWDEFYEGQSSKAVPEAPSSFAQWVVTQLQPGQIVAEFGFGNARDSLWIADRGHPVFGYDFAESAVRTAQRRAGGRDLSATFAALDLSDKTAVCAASDGLPSGLAFYGRFLIHSLEESARGHLFDLAARRLDADGALFLEFRTAKDRDEEHLFGNDHFRVYLEPDEVSRELRARGARITHQEEGRGLALYKSEDPHVARITARWNTPAHPG